MSSKYSNQTDCLDLMAIIQKLEIKILCNQKLLIATFLTIKSI